jgi:hypothetical protein
MKSTIVRLAAVLLALFAFSAFPAFAQDAPKIDGSWSLKMTGPNGEDIFIPFTLKVENGVITGEFNLGERNLKIEDGKLEGDKLSWTLKRQRGDGSAMVYKMTGKVESADKLTGNTSADMGGQNVDMPWSAARK